jgi:S-DNA-T family DNA segregation ATPase FtsK/SpoIIIE
MQPVPRSTWRALWRAPRGLLLAVWHGWRWLFDREGHDLRVHAVASRDPKAYATMARIRKDRVRTRLLVLVVFGVAVAIVAAIVHLAWPPSLWILAAAVVAALAWLGRPRDSRIIEPAVVVQEAQRVTPDIVVRALGSLGLSLISQRMARGGEIRVMVGRDGPGWHVEAELPHGATASDVAERRDRRIRSAQANGRSVA